MLILVALLLSVGFGVGANSTYGSPSDVKAAKQQFKKVRKEQKRLAKLARRLSKAELKRLKRTSRGRDSDGDGVPDLLEDTTRTNMCEAEFEKEGRIVSFDDPNLVIGDTTYVLTDSTTFRSKFGVFTRDSLISGKCVEVEGYISDGDPASNTVQKIKEKKDSSCNDNDDDGDDDDDEDSDDD
jgi:hypothetical protein